MTRYMHFSSQGETNAERLFDAAVKIIRKREVAPLRGAAQSLLDTAICYFCEFGADDECTCETLDNARKVIKQTEERP